MCSVCHPEWKSPAELSVLLCKLAFYFFSVFLFGPRSASFLPHHTWHLLILPLILSREKKSHQMGCFLLSFCPANSPSLLPVHTLFLSFTDPLLLPAMHGPLPYPTPWALATTRFPKSVCSALIPFLQAYISNCQLKVLTHILWVTSNSTCPKLTSSVLSEKNQYLLMFYPVLSRTIQLPSGRFGWLFYLIEHF